MLKRSLTRDMDLTDREFHLVIFGATGFTGKHVVEYVANISEKEANLKWAVAGRTKGKLQNILLEISSLTGKDLTKVQTIEADVDDAASLEDMCCRTQIVLNCIGPYVLYGEPVVKACIKNGAHHIDISAESLFEASMQLKYHEASQKAKVYIIGTSGYDSVPCETGIQYLQEKFDGDLCTVEVVSRITFSMGKTSANFGTLKSAILHERDLRELRDVHSKIFTDPIPKHPLQSRGFVNYFEEINAWCVPFANTDIDVVNRTQYYNYHIRHMRPIQMKSYLMIQGNYFKALTYGVAIELLRAMMKNRLGKYLLEKHPALMTLGVISKSGPTRKHIKEATFDTFLIGRGYQEKLSEPDGQHSTPPDKKMVVKVHGPEPGYTLTPMIMVQVALVVLQEKDKLPDEGGVFTPGSAFLNTSLMERLTKNGMTYDVFL